ncbi:EF-hand [Hesseltinella vesiculosa]|uniref:EF-hand n=1 Tax=Hesseltinella vesiculosa TaxID=101127 RepID=A0A1X2GLC9_9FUNG|nr:EF-hand [Hesseltinella vesiculosa]
MTDYAPGQATDINPQLWTWFRAVDTDGSGQLTVDELQRALINGDWSPFNIRTVHMMINMFDADNSGTIGFSEFTSLWVYIEEWRRCFQTFDRDGSGTIDRQELTQALRAFGFNVSEKSVAFMIQKLDRGSHSIPFDSFVRTCVIFKSITDSFRAVDTDQDGYIQIGYDQFLDLVIRQI